VKGQREEEGRKRGACLVLVEGDACDVPAREARDVPVRAADAAAHVENLHNAVWMGGFAARGRWRMVMLDCDATGFL
jgi:hypothetical protein